MMAELSHICPWWLIPVLDNPIRRLIHNPEKILSGCIGKGQTVLDLGCGSSTFTIALERWLERLEESLPWVPKMKCFKYIIRENLSLVKPRNTTDLCWLLSPLKYGSRLRVAALYRALSLAQQPL
jgi:hypothetical protein